MCGNTRRRSSAPGNPTAMRAGSEVAVTQSRKLRGRVQQTGGAGKRCEKAEAIAKREKSPLAGAAVGARHWVAPVAARGLAAPLPILTKEPPTGGGQVASGWHRCGRIGAWQPHFWEKRHPLGWGWMAAPGWHQKCGRSGGHGSPLFSEKKAPLHGAGNARPYTGHQAPYAGQITHVHRTEDPLLRGGRLHAPIGAILSVGRMRAHAVHA